MESQLSRWLAGYVMDQSSMVVLLITPDNVIIRANACASKLAGRDLAGTPADEFFIDFGDPATAGETRVIPKSGLINVNTASGLPETFHFTFFELGSEIIAVGEMNGDETSRLRTELMDMNRELNLLTRNLHKSNAELKKLNDLKNEFLGIAAHDLRNPIGIIMGYSSFLLDELDSSLYPDQIRILQTIQRTSEFMLHLLNELLDMSAIESGKLKLECTMTDLVAQIRKNAGLNGVVAAKKGIQIHVEAFEDLPLVKADKLKIEQVMNNLLSNAIKFSFPGTTIRINIFRSGDHVTVSVADQGQGIPADEIGLLFKPFQKTSIRATSGEKSTGLGLSIVRNIILGHQGKIWVESTPGKGSVFYLTLPIE